ncbi:MAG: M50 family metallopeptidase [Candidatus Micrarchaeota archaeon]
MEGKKLGALMVFAFTCFLFYIILISSASGLLKFGIVLVLMAGCGISLQALLKIDGQFGILLLRTQSGLHYIDDIANFSPRLWNACADFGIVLGFGLSSAIFFKKYKSGFPVKTFMFSMIVLLAVSQVMTIKVFQMIVLLINVPMDVTSLSEQMGTAISFVPIIIFAAMLEFGLCGVTVAGLVLNTYSILATLFSVLLSSGAKLSDAMPGASPIIPGINMPLAEGLIALGILLFIHELSHGILSRIGKVKLESAGLLLYGIIPVGAFIDPNENTLLKKSIEVQTRVFAAGSASNIILFIIVFFLLTGFEYVAASYQDPGVYLVSVEPGSPASEAGISAGDKLVSVEGTAVTWNNLGQLSVLLGKSDKVTVKTDKGSYLIQPKLSGDRKYLGVRLPPQPRFITGFEWLGFIKNTLGLILVLNFLVGVINLVPLFMAFDGYRILTINVQNQLLIKGISYSLFAMFLLNFLPWLWS